MTIKSCTLAFILCVLAPSSGFAETTWRFEPLGMECIFPAHWILEEAPQQGDLAKGGVLIRADRTPGIPAGVRFELSLEPLAISRSTPDEALEAVLVNLKGTPKLQVLNSEKNKVASNVSEVRVIWKIAQSQRSVPWFGKTSCRM